MAAVPELRPFTALRPLPQLAHRVAAPPYDVVDAEQARAAMLAAPDSFLRVTRPDADPWLEAAPAPGEEHEHGRQALHELVRRGVLVREEAPALWVYRQQVPRSPLGSRVQTGVVGLAGVGDYEALVAERGAKDRLRAWTDGAVAAGVFGVPTLAVGDALFWGVDAMPMAERYLDDPGLLARGEMARLAGLPVGVWRGGG